MEFGQNIRTSLTQAVGEELRTGPGHIQLVMGDTMLTPYDMGTFGSRTTPTMAPQLHQAAAAAREMLIDLAAAERWKTIVTAESLIVEEGRVKNPASGCVALVRRIDEGPEAHEDHRSRCTPYDRP